MREQSDAGGWRRGFVDSSAGAVARRNLAVVGIVVLFSVGGRREVGAIGELSLDQGSFQVRERESVREDAGVCEVGVGRC